MQVFFTIFIMTLIITTKHKKTQTLHLGFCRAEDEARTRDNQLGRLELYQLSYFRIIVVQI